VGEEKERHPAHAQVAAAIAQPIRGMDLRVGIIIAHALDVDHDLVSARGLESEV
jgi:hypothetical protein